MVNDDDWTAGYANQLAAQIDTYNNDPELKRVAFKQLGLTLQKLVHKETVRNRIEGMIASVDTNNESQRLGFAQVRKFEEISDDSCKGVFLLAKE